MSLQDTNLLLQLNPVTGTLNQTPAQFASELVQRMKIVSPTGTSFIVVGDAEPSSNLGPWLKGGTQWWVFDEETKRYVPQDISESETIWFHFGNTTPQSTPPFFWLRTTGTAETPVTGVSWYVFNGTSWVPFNSVPPSGPTANRPNNPVDFQQFYDSDISTLIWWERGAWRTVAGSPGDTKFVALNTLEEALTRNPGWEVFGNANQNLRGRYISQATRDAGGGGTVLIPPVDVAERQAFETYGESDGVQLNGASPVPYPPTVALWFLVKQ